MRHGLAVLVGIAVLVPDLWVLDPSVVKWLALYAICLVVPFVIEWRFDRVDALILAFVSYATLSLLWSPDWKAGLFGLQNVFPLALLIILCRERFNAGLCAGIVVVGTAILSLWWPEPFGGFGNENYRTDALLIAGPLLLTLNWRFWPLWVAWAVLLVLTGTGSTLAAGGALIAALAVWLVWTGKFYWVVFISALGVNGFIWLEGWQYWSSPTVWHRAELWHNALVLISESPVFGHGLGSWDFEYPRVAERHLWFMDRTLLTNIGMRSGAAHNDLLQGVVALGVIGGGLGIAILSHARWLSWAGISVICGLGTAAVGFPLQLPASAMLFCVALGSALPRRSSLA